MTREWSNLIFLECVFVCLCVVVIVLGALCLFECEVGGNRINRDIFRLHVFFVDIIPFHDELNLLANQSFHHPKRLKDLMSM